MATSNQPPSNPLGENQNLPPSSIPSPIPQPLNPTATPLNPLNQTAVNPLVSSDLNSRLESEAPSDGAAKRSWKQTLFPSETQKLKFKLRFIPPIARDSKTFGVCSMDAVKGELAVLDYTLVGFFLGKRPSFSLVKNSLLRQWKIQGNVEILQLPHGDYAFRFSNLVDRDSILDGEVFFIGGQPMFIRQWDRSLHTGGVLGLRKVPLWITLPGLPLHLWGEESLSAICSVLGTPLYSDRTTAMKTRLMFARVCVEFSGASPLLETINIEDEVGMTFVQKVEYEWKPPQCTKCGVFGHKGCADLGSDSEISLKQSDQLGPVGGSPAAVAPQQPISIPGNVDIEKEAGCSSGEEKELDVGWQVFRARKKSPIGSGSQPRSMTRFQAQEVNGFSAGKDGVGEVSSSYGAATVQGTSNQVCQPASLPSLDNFSNSKSGAGKKTWTITNLEKGKKRKDSIGCQPAIEDQTTPENLNFGGPPPKSSAGHTPFPSRLSIMARDLRLGKVRSGPQFRTQQLTQSGRAEAGQRKISQAQSNVTAGLDLLAHNDSLGPDSGAENGISSGCLSSTNSHERDQNGQEPIILEAHHDLDGSIQPDPGEDDELPKVHLGPSMEVFENPDYMGCEELEIHMKKGARMGSDKGYNPTSSR